MTARIQPEDTMTRVELDRLVKCAKDCIDKNLEQMIRLQQREKTVGYVTHSAEALLALDNDNFILMSAIGKLLSLDLHIPSLK